MVKRNIGQELLESVEAIQSGKGRRFHFKTVEDIKGIREKMNLSQSAFAALLGVSDRTLQDWEQGRRHPSGPAQSLLMLANAHPKILKETFSLR